MRALQDQAFEFGGFVLVPNERLLLHAGEPIPLIPKAFDLLVVLVRRSGHLVTKDELFAEVWPNTFVQETNLSVNMSAVRKALARTDNANEFIETVPGRGYRFVAPVVWRAQTERTAAPFASVAILPFSSDSLEHTYLADGLTEAVVNGLAQFTPLRVAPRATTSRFRGSSIRPREAGH